MLKSKKTKTCLFIRPPIHKGVLYYRIEQYIGWLEKKGFEVDIVHRSEKEGRSKVLKSITPLIQMPRIIHAVWHSNYVIVFPMPFMLLAYILIAKGLGKKVVIDHFNSYVAQKEVNRLFPILIDKIAYNLADRIIAISNSLGEEIATTFNLPSEKVECLFPVVDLEVFSPKYGKAAGWVKDEFGLAGKFVVLYHGMHHPWHGLNYLLEATALLKNQDDIRFVVIPKDHLEHLYSGNVIFPNEVPHNELPPYIQAADVWCGGFGVHPRGERTMSTTLTEAQAMEKPVITSQTQRDKRELLDDNETVFFVEPESAEAIADKILYCKDNPEVAKRVGENGRKLVEQSFSTSKLDETLSKVFCEEGGQK